MSAATYGSPLQTPDSKHRRRLSAVKEPGSLSFMNSSNQTLEASPSMEPEQNQGDQIEAESLTKDETEEKGTLETDKSEKEEDDHSEAPQPPNLCGCIPCRLNWERKGDRVSFAVEYRDSGDQFIATESRDKLFDIGDAWKDATNKNDKAFAITTILNTSLPVNTHTRNPADRKAILTAGILNNVNIDINTKTMRLTIYSHAIIDAIRATVPYYANAGIWNDTLSLTEPFCLLAHHQDELFAYRSECQSAEPGSAVKSRKSKADRRPLGRKVSQPEVSYEHLGLLLDQFHQLYGNRIEEERRRHERGICTFNMLWLLLKPGTTVYVGSKGAFSARVIQSVDFEPNLLSHGQLPQASYVISLWYLDFDGQKVGRRNTEEPLVLSPFDGERDIRLLNIIPCQFLDTHDGRATRTQLVKNGRKWFGCLTGGLLHFSGEFLVQSKSKNNKLYEGRVVIDCASFWENNESKFERPVLGDLKDDFDQQAIANCQCKACSKKRSRPGRADFIWNGYDSIDPTVTESLELSTSHELADLDHRYLLCSGILGGFALKTRTWEYFNVAHCSDAKTDVGAIDRLVMKPSRKEMITALIQKHANRDADQPLPEVWGADFVKDKGEECIAEYTGRPLLALTCGDIGTNESTIEQHLSKWFRLGEKWGAVILIDEADIYLERREPQDLQRNGLVSVFLRSLEYYKGVLFLTTNRVGHFDDAFISRIHVIIHYENLTVSQQQEIWNLFFQKLEKERKDIRVEYSAKKFIMESKEMTRIGWNGREIRNAFQTAVSLAQYKSSMEENRKEDDIVRLDRCHIEEVCDLTIQFKGYLKRINGNLDENQRAFGLKDRDDLPLVKSKHKTKVEM